MKTLIPLVLLASLSVSPAGSGTVHGVQVGIKEVAPAVIATCTYTGDGPLANAEVTIYSPADSETAFQQGRTDPKGVFAFVPEAPGEWKFVVDDGLGHRKEVSIILTESFFEAGEADRATPEGESAAVGGRARMLSQSVIAMIVAGVIVLIGAIVFVRLRS